MFPTISDQQEKKITLNTIFTGDLLGEWLNKTSGGQKQSAKGTNYQLIVLRHYRKPAT